MKILIVDDEESLCFALSELFKHEGYETITSQSAEAALTILENESIDAAVLDYNLPGINGIDLLTIIKENYNWIQVILVTAFGSEEVAIEAIKKGAYDYIAKPFNNVELLNRLNHIEESIKKKEVTTDTEFGHYFSNSMNAIIEKIKAVAKTDVPILITGESGTGKELIANLCHHHSGRKGKFISVNCSALPASLIESELFGAEKGAYTGSTAQKKGFFELADNGTIFLDEIGEMPFEMQAKLLRVLQENEIVRIGGGLPIKINSRVIAATNRNIEEEIQNNNFREDLYYRLNVIQLKIPALKARKEEIKPLALTFLNNFNKKYNKNILGFDEETMKEMQEFSWPGNIRELQNKIEKAVVLCASSWITIGDMALESANITAPPENKQEPTAPPPPYATSGPITGAAMGKPFFNFNELPTRLVEAKKILTEMFEKEFILHYLNKNEWNVKQTAENIGLCRQDLYKKMKKVGIKKDVKYS